MENLIIYEEMIGKKFDKVFQYVSPYDKYFIIFELNGIPEFVFYHNQDCCESVYIEDVAGELEDLSLGVITEAEEYTKEAGEEVYDSGTYTFYKFSSTRGCVNIRWIGESNGYYSESVDYFSWETFTVGDYLNSELRSLFSDLYPNLEV